MTQPNSRRDNIATFIVLPVSVQFSVVYKTLHYKRMILQQYFYFYYATLWYMLSSCVRLFVRLSVRHTPVLYQKG